jgi:hypothetical protein
LFYLSSFILYTSALYPFLRLQLPHSPGLASVFPYGVAVYLCLDILADSPQSQNTGEGVLFLKRLHPKLKIMNDSVSTTVLEELVVVVKRSEYQQLSEIHRFIEALANVKLASNVFNQYSYEYKKVRHPAHGGKTMFVNGIKAVMDNI